MRVGMFALVALVVMSWLAVAAETSSIADFIHLARKADIVVLGEVHDNAAHHANQAAIVAALRPAALVFEMFPQASEEKINELRASGAKPAEIAAALDWSSSGWPDFSYYAAILAAAPHAQVFGAGQPTADVRRAVIEGAAGAFGPDAITYGLDDPLSPQEQAAREKQQFEAHCGLVPAEVLPGMVEAQRFRDAGLADAALWARTMTGGGQVVVITGSEHADKARGMPAAVAIADPKVKLVSLGQFETAVNPAEASHFDGWMVTAATNKGDRCGPLRAPRN